MVWAQAQNITIKILQREKDGQEEIQIMTGPLTISLLLKHQLFLSSIEDLNERFYSKKCSWALPLCGTVNYSWPMRADLKKTSLPGLLWLLSRHFLIHYFNTLLIISISTFTAGVEYRWWGVTLILLSWIVFSHSVI